MLIEQAAVLYSVNAGASGNRLEVTKRLASSVGLWSINCNHLFVIIHESESNKINHVIIFRFNLESTFPQKLENQKLILTDRCWINNHLNESYHMIHMLTTWMKKCIYACNQKWNFTPLFRPLLDEFYHKKHHLKTHLKLL